MVTPRRHEMSISIILYSMALMSYCGNKLLISMSNPTCMSVLENIEKKLTPKGSSKLYCNHQVSTSDYLQLIFISRCFCSMYYQGSTNCAILPSRMGEHGVKWESMEKMETINQTNKNTLLSKKKGCFE